MVLNITYNSVCKEEKERVTPQGGVWNPQERCSVSDSPLG